MKPGSVQTTRPGRVAPALPRLPAFAHRYRQLGVAHAAAPVEAAAQEEVREHNQVCNQPSSW